MNKQRTGESILKERISRFSLGVQCDRLYDALNHVNQEVYLDPVDGRRYARNQIAWFIRKVSQVLWVDSFRYLQV